MYKKKKQLHHQALDIILVVYIHNLQHINNKIVLKCFPFYLMIYKRKKNNFIKTKNHHYKNFYNQK